MAFKLDIRVHATGLLNPIIYKDGYAVISRLTGRKRLYIDVSFLTSRDGTQLKSTRFDFLPDLEGESYHKQAYVYLKSLPEFANAVNVFETD